MANKAEIQHIAFIMDGNGRWAKKHGLDTLDGHRAGEKTVRKVMDLAEEFQIKYTTFYAFSTENWKRSQGEVKGLMSLLGASIDNNLAELHEKGVRVRAIGEIGAMPAATREKVDTAVSLTQGNDKSHMVIALNYGGRAEIARATRQIAAKVANGSLKIKNINESTVAENLYVPDIPDPDLMIRTSGEFRISNFLLWQLSYSELYFTETLWPDFGRDDFIRAIEAYKSRKRRFGGR
ncbi:MAG: di-trans,poly-cis-decaprenylcistransferase [Victivallales bacterium]|nr:di-trans,poly-cis-decaprenylcistransferase [Victivallales bacterium]